MSAPDRRKDGKPAPWLAGIYQDVDGFFYYDPPGPGSYAAHTLREIAAKLDEMNKPWEETIERELNPTGSESNPAGSESMFQCPKCGGPHFNIGTAGTLKCANMAEFTDLNGKHGGCGWRGTVANLERRPAQNESAQPSSKTEAATPDSPQLARPSTRGELAQRLKAGEACEVAGYVEEMTSIMLRHWLGVDKFTVTPSNNPGWVIYTPIGSR